MQAIQTRFHGPTNTRGARISAKADAGRISIQYDYAAGSGEGPHRKAAEALCKKLGWEAVETLVSGQLPNGDYAFVFAEASRS